MKITVLAENISRKSEYGAEHGLSLFIETKEHKILFDMGQSSLFAENAQKMGIDLEDADIAILSHGHYDHGGGLATFLDLNKKASVFLSRHAFGKYYNGTEKYIGLDGSLMNNPRLVFAEDSFDIAKGLTLHSCNKKEKQFFLGSFGLKKLNNDEFSDDDFLHEHYLLIEEEGKKVLISGCSHKGVPDIVRWFKPDVLIGGFHFSKLELDDTLRSYAEYLNSFETDFFTCHCTGEEQYEFMKKFMERLEYVSVGDIIQIQE